MLIKTQLRIQHIKWLSFSWDLGNLYLLVHFPSIWFNDIIAFTNSNSDSAFPQKISPWLFNSVKLFPPAVNSTIQFSMIFSMNFMTSSNMLYILRQSIIHLCGTISCIFLSSINAIATFSPLVLLSLRMSWSIYSNSPVPLVPLWHPFYFSGNSPRLINEL